MKSVTLLLATAICGILSMASCTTYVDTPASDASATTTTTTTTDPTIYGSTTTTTEETTVRY